MARLPHLIMRLAISRAVRMAGVFAALLAAVAIGPERAIAVEIGDFPIPEKAGEDRVIDGKTFNHYLTGALDKDRNKDGVKETVVEIFLSTNGDGDFVASYTAFGQVWAWVIGYQAWQDSRNYVVVDSDCDGAFDARYGHDEHFYLPECVRSGH